MSETRAEAAVGRCDIAAWLIAALLLPAILLLHLLPALLAGLLVFQLVHLLAPLLQRRISSERAKVFAVALLAALVVGVVAALLVTAVAFFRSDAGSLPALFQKMAEIIEHSRANMPPWLLEHLPDYGANGDNVKEAVVHWLRDHAAEVKLFGAQAGRGVVHVVIGMVIGAIISLSEAQHTQGAKPLSRALTERARRLAESFHRIVFAQLRISAINTGFTAIYLAVVLPLSGVDLPYTAALIVITFIVGLLPVIGNLISNTFIVVVSLAHSPGVAFASLGFLVVIHKLEYFLNARIVGGRIRAHAWELLLAMVTMEAAFGLGGLVAAPIYYAYIKDELGHRGLV
jgi:predicted PurR-regulated permease PerM